ncbi:MAG: hypothetical protein HRU27_19395 [Rhizobiaceae bacterium]|nr:hypothetical protein [Hyphomicrobiales bacterium]NRB32759.1 hypothetical protein [Rhizobiaceae bacterium]
MQKQLHGSVTQMPKKGETDAGLNRAAAMKVAALEDEVRRMKIALERLASPAAFHTAGTASPEDQARMVFAQAVLDGESLKTAESHAVARARRAHEDFLRRSLRDG